MNRAAAPPDVDGLTNFATWAVPQRTGTMSRNEGIHVFRDLVDGRGREICEDDPHTSPLRSEALTAVEGRR